MAAPTLRFGIAGLGVASTQVLPYLSTYPNAKVTAAADPRREALDKFKSEHGGETFLDIEGLCKSPNVDAIYICTPNHLHAQHVVMAAEHKKHIVVEKPMALTIDECEVMNEAAERNGVHLLCGHTHSFDPAVRKMAEIVGSGDLGKLGMIHTWDYTDLMYRPRMPHELDTSRGGGAIYIQGPHQVDIVRLIGGGMVRSVRGTVGMWDRSRPSEGAYVGYLDFEDGAVATIVYSGYAHFDSGELHYWLGESGQRRDPETNWKSRTLLKQAEDETTLKESMRYGGTREGGFAHLAPEDERHQAFFGLTIVSCHDGDLRQSPDGVYVYDEEGRHEVTLPPGKTSRQAEIDELYQAVVNEKPVFHDGRWGEATLEVCLALYDSARERKEIFLSHQVPTSA